MLIDVQPAPRQPLTVKITEEDRRSSGTLVISFRATADAEVLRLVGPQGELVLTIASGRLDGVVRARQHTRRLDAEDAIGLDDGALHTVAVTSTVDGMHVFIEGYEIFSTSLSVWTQQLLAESLTIDPQGILDCGVLRVFAEPLSWQGHVAQAAKPQPAVTFAAATLSDRDVRRLDGTAEGSVWARVRARGRGQAGTVFAARGSLGWWAVNLTDRGFVVGSFDGHTHSEVVAGGSFDDGGWHDLVVTSGRGALTVYVDGYQRALSPGEFFFADLGSLNQVCVGQDLEGARLFGEATAAAIFDRCLSPHEVLRLVSAAPLRTQALFDTGLLGAASYRIPTLLTCESGVVLAGADQRVSINNDAPNDINFVLRRSLDGGCSWQEPHIVGQLPGGGARGSSVTDPVLVQDRSTGRVLLITDHFPGGIGQPNCEAGTGHTADGQLLLYDASGEQFLCSDSGDVCDLEGNPSDYRVNSAGDVTLAGEKVGNIYLADGGEHPQALRVARTSFLAVRYSDDDGATWSAPRDITAQVKKPWMVFLGTGPGNGVQLRSGRIVVPVYYGAREGQNHYTCALMMSDDGGDTWRLGQGVSDPVTPADSLYESTVVETCDEQGQTMVHLFARNQHPSGKVAHAMSQDGGDSFGPVDYVDELEEIFSQPNAISITLPGSGKEAVVFANASRMLPFRGCGAVRVSVDGCRTWPHSRVFQPRHYVYQCMSQLPDGRIGLLWEREFQGVFFTILDPDWLIAA
ncbi:hypothetical protein CAQU_01300 [Corynebacterium aquilae DSM 44791]|uniref:exo-alpha-sialidase n=1 Tax=Corynebacterium aquilae DSM 44791 TaxID=1431546 RepID=A0A1L7CDI8_9CORY|nr:hypothetical protein CAQU_01300 [Corynebacterium aquilae DSM 44791]